MIKSIPIDDDGSNEQADEILHLVISNGALDMPLAKAMVVVDRVLAAMPNLPWATRSEVRQRFEAIWREHNEEYLPHPDCLAK